MQGRKWLGLDHRHLSLVEEAGTLSANTKVNCLLLSKDSRSRSSSKLANHILKIYIIKW